jgi:hypothetical protein
MRRRKLHLLATGACLSLAAAALASCTGDATTAEVRSLERTGQVALVCLGAPGGGAAFRPLSDCTSLLYDSPRDYGTDGTVPHLYALITLEQRGEVAVIDLSTEEDQVLDQDTSTPGETPLPVGAQPTSIVATEKGTSAFVTSADVRQPGIYALPGELLRPCESDPDGAASERCDAAPPTLSSWPGCRLDEVPGQMVIVADPPQNGQVRLSCADTTYTDVSTSELRNIDGEGLGRQKLYVTLPRKGTVAVIDAQSVLDAAPGTFDPCVIEAEVALTSTPPEVSDAEFAIEQQPGCAVPELPQVRANTAYVSTPAGVALAADRLYIGDLTAPLIHVLDTTDPCNPQEIEALAPVSFEDPSRVVVTSSIAVSPEVSPSLKRYLYAIDIDDKSVMVFDVSKDAADVLPLRRPNAAQNPLQPPDRVRFAAAPTDIAIVSRDAPRSTDSGGIAAFGTLCDPTCDPSKETCGDGVQYRTSGDYEDGAGPYEMRGIFAMIALGSGQIATLDIEDYDAPCRGPGEAAACQSSGGAFATGEPSCNVVQPHSPRSGVFLLSNEDTGRHIPGVLTYPVLSLDDGTVISSGIRMRAGGSGVLAVGGELVSIPEDGTVVDDQGPRNTLVFNLGEPRVHVQDQEVAVTYQGALPSFSGNRGDLRLDSFDRELIDESAGFCAGGVQSEGAVREELQAQGISGAALEAAAVRLADRVHISQALASQDATYWDAASCGFEQCRAIFGDEESPTPSRDLRVVEARDDKLELAAPTGVSDDLFECCFPTLVEYEIRPGDEWTVVGSSSGFDHAVIADPVSGVCRPSCDPRLALRKSRARTGELYSGILFQFQIEQTDGALERDMSFRFTTQGSFVPLRGVLTNDDRPYVQPQALVYSRATDDLLITDGGLEGLLVAPADLNGDISQFF